MSKLTDAINANIVKITDQMQEDGKQPFAQMVFDPDEKSLRVDICGDLKLDQPAGSADHYHVPLNRKQAVKMIKLLEEFLLWNRE